MHDMPTTLDFHGSEIDRIEAAGRALTVLFSAAHVQRTADASAAAGLTGFLTALEMRFEHATWDGVLADCLGRLTAGRVVAGGLAQPRLVLPCSLTGGVNAELQFANGMHLAVSAASLVCRFASAPRFVEDFRC